MSKEPKKMDRRKFVNYAIAVIVTGIVVGVGTYFAVPPKEVIKTVTETAKAETITKTVTITSPITPTKPKVTIPPTVKELKFRHWFDLSQPGSRAAAYRLVLETFEKKYGVKVNVELVPWDKIDVKWIADVEAKVVPDVSLVSPQLQPVHWKAGSLYPLNEYLDTLSSKEKKDLELAKPIIDGFHTWDGKVIGLPVEIHTRAVFYRRNLLEAIGLTDLVNKLETKGVKDLDDLLDVGRTIKKESKGKNPETGGEMFPGLLHYQHVRALVELMWAPYLWEFGGELYESPLGKATWHKGDAPIKATKYVLTWFLEELTPMDMLTAKWVEARKQVVDGRLAMFMDGNYAIPYYRAQGLNEKTLGIFKHPTKIFTNSWSIGMSPLATKDRKDATWIFIKHWVIDIMPEFAATYGAAIPTTFTALERPELKTGTTGYYFKVLKEVAEKYAKSIMHEHYTELLDTLGPVLQKIVAEKVTDEKEIARRLEKAARVFNEKFYG
jgi:ABC-type glycerol-3-phosphate transport system substrate-binding protein